MSPANNEAASIRDAEPQNAATNSASNGDQTANSTVRTLKPSNDDPIRFDRSASASPSTNSSVTITEQPTSTAASSISNGTSDSFASSKRDFVGPNNFWMGEHFHTVSRQAGGAVRLPTPPIDDKGRRGAICIFETSERWAANKWKYGQ
jgi:CCR4-NOT transcriptional regulation complex NOT5 subunit